MKTTTCFLFACIISLSFTPSLSAQDADDNIDHAPAIYALIADYAEAREKKDLTLLDAVFAEEIDQLTSSGEWRRGKQNSLDGVMRSSAARPGARTITVDNIRFVNAGSAIADARYEIKNADGSVRKMWSTFIVVYDDVSWRISGIRNMLPAE